MQVEQTIDNFRVAVRRELAPLVGWIPDVNRFTPRQMRVAGVVAAIVGQLLIALLYLLWQLIKILLAALIALLFPHFNDRPPLVPSRPLEVQLVPMPQSVAPDPLVQRRTPLLQAQGLDAKQEKPKVADFEDDKDTIAGAEKPPTGLVPLPSQEGRDLPLQDFANQDVRLGTAPEKAPETLRTDIPPDKMPQPIAPNVSPLYTPQPVAPEAVTAAETAAPTDKLPDPAKVARATPPPLKMSDKPEQDSLAMLMATPAPKPLATPAPVPQVAPTLQPPKPSITDRYQENMRKTSVEGNVATPGKNGVNAINTPMGRWNRRLHMQIQSLCDLKQRAAVGELGTVLVTIKVRQDGSVQSAKVVDDGGSPHHTEVILQVIQEIRPEQLPAEALPEMENGVLEIPLRFVLY